MIILIAKEKSKEMSGKRCHWRGRGVRCLITKVIIFSIFFVNPLPMIWIEIIAKPIFTENSNFDEQSRSTKSA